MDRVVTFRLPAARPEVESACRRALRSVDWQELPTDTFKIEPLPPITGNDVFVLLGLIPFVRRRLMRLLTVTRVAPTPSPAADAVVYGVWGRAVMVTISLRDREVIGTEVIITGQGGLPGKAAAAVRDLRHSIEIQSGSVNSSRPSQP